MEQDGVPVADRNGIIRALPKQLSEENRQRITKFSAGMFMYDFVQNYWVRPRVHKADPKKHREIIRDVIAPLREAVVLDIACGTGAAIPHFDNSNDYTGLDLSYAMLRQAVRKAQNKGFRRYALIEGNAEERLFPRDNFDFVLIDTSLHMIPQYRKCIGEATRALKTGGELFCSCPTVGINRKFDALWSKIASRRNLHSLTESDLQAVCLQSGLTYERVWTNGGVLYFRAYKA